MTGRALRVPLVLGALCLLLAGCSSTGGAAPTSTRSLTSTPAAASPTASNTPSRSAGAASTTGPRVTRPSPPAHIVVVVEENHSFADIDRSPSAPFMTSLAASGVSLTRYFAVTHPSEPNYLALFSGSTQHRSDDSCPHHYPGANLASQLRASHRSFVGYSDGLPRSGYTGCTSGAYARKHAPWVDFSNLPAAVNQPLSAFPTDYRRLPTLSFVIPNLQHDMHDGTITQADTWLRLHLGAYARWARTHNSLLVVTWDEDDGSQRNQVPTVVAGAGVRPGRYDGRADLYNLLRTFEWLYGLPPIGNAAHRSQLRGVWTH